MRMLGWIVSGLPVIDSVALACLLAWLAPVNPGGATLLGPASSLLMVPLAVYLFRQFGIYDSHRVHSVRTVIANLLAGHAAAALACLAMQWVFQPGLGFGRGIVLACAGSLGFQIVSKCGANLALRRIRRRGFDQHQVIFSGPWERAQEFSRQLESRAEWGMRIHCVRSGDGEFYTFPEKKPLGSDAEAILRRGVIQEVVIPIGVVPADEAFAQAQRFARYGLQVRYLLQPVSLNPSERPELWRESRAVAVTTPARSDRDLAGKRVVDIVLSTLLLIAIAPLLALIAIVVKLTSPGPVFFKQARVGLFGRQFQMYKFRSMVDGAELLMKHAHRSITNGPVFKDVDDYRVTPVGRILRRFSLDELPQLWNVLRGDMSMVGPRPLPVSEAAGVTGDYWRRFMVPQGLTCIWQVSGRSNLTYDEWMQCDLRYIDAWSLWFDAILILRTIPAVLTGRGAY